MRKKAIMTVSTQDLAARLNQTSKKAATPQASTPKPQGESQRYAWLQTLGERIIDTSNKMEADQAFREQMRSKVR